MIYSDIFIYTELRISSLTLRCVYRVKPNVHTTWNPFSKGRFPFHSPQVETPPPVTIGAVISKPPPYFVHVRVSPQDARN